MDVVIFAQNAKAFILRGGGMRVINSLSGIIYYIFKICKGLENDRLQCLSEVNTLGGLSPCLCAFFMSVCNDLL